MTDKEALLELLKRFGIVADLRTFIPKRFPHQPVDVELPPLTEGVTLTAQEGNVDGYDGFYATFRFTMDGQFLNVGVWE